MMARTPVLIEAAARESRSYRSAAAQTADIDLGARMISSRPGLPTAEDAFGIPLVTSTSSIAKRSDAALDRVDTLATLAVCRSGRLRLRQ